MVIVEINQGDRLDHIVERNDRGSIIARWKKISSEDLLVKIEESKDLGRFLAFEEVR